MATKKKSKVVDPNDLPLFDGSVTEDMLKEQYDSDVVLLLSQEPFYGYILSNLGIKFDVHSETTVKDVPPLCVNYIQLIISNRRFNDYEKSTVGPSYYHLETSERLALLQHEVLHIAFFHCSLTPGHIHALANIAQDLKINYLLDQEENKTKIQGRAVEFGDRVRKYGCFPTIKGTSASWEASEVKFTFPNWKDLDFPDVYNIMLETLYQEFKKQKQQPKIQLQCTCSSCESGTDGNQGESSGEPQEDPNNKGQNPSNSNDPQDEGDEEKENNQGGKSKNQVDANCPIHGNNPQPNKGSQSFDQFLDSFVKASHYIPDTDVDDPQSEQHKVSMGEVIARACDETQKNQGNIAALVKETMDKFGDSKLPWWIILRNRIKSRIDKDDFQASWSKRKLPLGIITPGLLSQKMNTIFFALDTSGSMSDLELEQGIAELRALFREGRTKMAFVCVDAQAGSIMKIDDHELLTLEKINKFMYGRGGTDFRPAFDAAEKYLKENPEETLDLFVYFTDMYGTFPEKRPHYDVLWCSTQGVNNAPFGEVVDVRMR
jgi:predicted metal-dependent peptidase